MDWTPILKIIGLVLGVMVGSGGVFFAVKKIGSSFIGVALTITEFVKTQLQDAGVANERLYDILDITIQALTYAETISDNTVTIDVKVEKALTYINNFASTLNITLTDVEKTMITLVLKVGFTYMNNLVASGKKVVSHKYKAIAMKNIKASLINVPVMPKSYVKALKISKR